MSAAFNSGSVSWNILPFESAIVIIRAMNNE
jgi:hypothetical protein